jgi:hypothetical protein
VTKATIAKISASNQNLSMPVAQASPSGWVIQGYVRDINLNPLPKLTVYLADSNTMFQSEYGINYTDDSGYYSIEYAGTGDKADPDAKVPTLYVALINPRGNPAYITPKPVSLSFGATTVLDISLTSVDQTIGDPDKQIRQLALPNEQVATAPST